MTIQRCRPIVSASLRVAVLVVLLMPSADAAPPSLVVTFDPAVRAEPFTGRVYVFFTRGDAEPRFGPDWFHPEPFVSQDVRDWKPGEPLTFAAGDESLHAYPKPYGDLKLDGFRAQAVARFNPWEREVGRGTGNGFGQVVPLHGDDAVRLTINRLVEPRPYEETAWGKLFEVRSPSLSEFHGRDVFLRGTVILPSSYHDESQRRYPTIFTIPGFGGDHRIDPVREPIPERNEQGVEFLRVMLDPNMPLGHHVFADSRNNGPVGTAFVREFLPAFDKAFRTIPEPTARFVTGHSSGGWSSLWLQVSQPETFGGCWSTAPDPVDFRDFQQIDLYRPGENMYFDRAGAVRPLSRGNGHPVILYRDFDRMEQVLGHGGQLQSFEAVFGPQGENGRPVPLWDRRSGMIDGAVADTWKRYDIRLVLEENWPTLGPKLAGKIHVVMGEKDTFYLEGAVRLLKESLERLGSDARVELVPNRDHSTLLTPDLRSRMRREMTTTFLRHHPRGR